MPRKKRKPNHDMARRLEAVRSRTGLSLTKFRESLLEGGEYEVSYQAAQNYHFDRPAPIDYLAKVAEVFEADFTYLATGTETDFHPVDEAYIDRIEAVIPRFEGMASALERTAQHRELQVGLLKRVKQQLDGTRFLLPAIHLSACAVRKRAGHPNVVELIRSWHHNDPEPEDLERHIQDELALCKLLDDVFANTWEGMREIVASEFGAESVERLTLEQQIRFSDAMVLALSCLFPDHGDPASFRERRTTKEEES